MKRTIHFKQLSETTWSAHSCNYFCFAKVLYVLINFEMLRKQFGDLSALVGSQIA